MKVTISSTFYGFVKVDTETKDVSYEIDTLGDSDPSDQYVVVGEDGGTVWEGDRSEAPREAQGGPDDPESESAQIAVEQIALAENAIQEHGFFPGVTLDAETVAAYTADSKAKHRAHLITQIEAGNLACAKILKEQYGESIRLKVEIVEAAEAA